MSNQSHAPCALWVPFSVSAFMLVVFGQIQINDVLIACAAKSEYRSRVYALRYIVTFSISAASVSVIAWIHGSWGFSMLFVVLALGAAGILAAVLMLPKTGSFIRVAADPVVTDQSA